MKSGAPRARRRITQSELIAFLRRLAAMYDNPRTGNVGLAEALHELVDTLAQQMHHPSLPLGETRQGSPSSQGYYATKFENLDLDSVGRVISDESATKRELIELASARFSIPRSR